MDYEPAESSTGLFGGNSNWRGPIWFPVNYLIIESLQKFHFYLGDDYKVECPTGSGQMMTLWEVSAEISRRLSHIFLKNNQGRRPVFGASTNSRMILTGAITSCFTSTSTAILAQAWARVIRLAGQVSSQSYCNRVGNSRTSRC